MRSPEQKPPRNPMLREVTKDRRRARKEIILGWQRNSSSTPKPSLTTLFGAQPLVTSSGSSTPTTSNVQGDNEILGPGTETATGEKEDDAKETDVAIIAPRASRKKQPQPQPQPTAEPPRTSPVSSGLPTSSREDAIPKTSSRTATRKPAHLRVYSSSGADRARSRSRGARRRLKTAKEETVFHWTRESSFDAKQNKISGADKVDKNALLVVARRLETQKRYEEDKKDAIGKMRGRRYRAGGSSRATRSRSPGTKSRRKEQTAEIQMTWQRQPASKFLTSSRIQRIPSSTTTVQGIGRRDANAPRKGYRTNSVGDDLMVQCDWPSAVEPRRNREE